MQGKIHHGKRRDYRQKILGNISDIIFRIDDLDKAGPGIRDHIHMQDRFFFLHGRNFTEYEMNGTEEELEGLCTGTCEFLSCLERIRTRLNGSILAYFYNYHPNPVFSEFSSQEAETQ